MPAEVDMRCCDLRSWTSVVFLTSLATYIILGSYQLDLPGLYYDEALDAVPAMQTLSGQALDIAGVINSGGREWPLMVMSYVGPITTYLLMPFFVLFGVSVEILRATNLLIGLATLILAYGFLSEFFDKRVAALSTLLLAVNPTFIFWSRTGAMVSLPLLPLAILVFWCLWRWFHRRQNIYFVFAAFCLGLGLATKILFLWLWLGLGLSWLVFSPYISPGGGWRAWLWPLKQLTNRTRILALFATLLGCAPLIIYNSRDAGTIRALLENLTHTRLYGVSNLDILTNLRTVFMTDLRTLLDGSIFASSFGRAHANPVAVVAFICTLLLHIWLIRQAQFTYRPIRLKFLILICVSIVSQSAFTISGFGAHHLMIIWPIPQVVITAAFTGLANHLHYRAPEEYPQWRLLLGLIFIIIVGSEMLTTVQYHRTLSHTRGNGWFSDAINVLAEDLQHVSEPIIALDWGFRRNLQLLTLGQIDPEERFTYGARPDESFDFYINSRVAQAPAFYLLHSPQFTAFPGHRQLFEDAAYRHRLQPVLWKDYEQHDGHLVYEVYYLEPISRTFEAPPMQHYVKASFGEVLSLFGHTTPQIKMKPTTEISVTLYWQALTVIPVNYKVFVHLFDETGQLWAQHDSPPMLGGHPTMEWIAGEVVEDRIRLSLNETLPVGKYRLFVGMYYEPTMERLPITINQRRLEGDTVEIAIIDVVQE